jgi:hypothetical protein
MKEDIDDDADEFDATALLFEALTSGDFLDEAMEYAMLHAPGAIGRAFEKVAKLKAPVPRKAQAAFLPVWIDTGCESLRKYLPNVPITIAALRVLLPPYKGNDVGLFRGASWREWEEKTFGMSWTDERKVGRIHARKPALFGLDGALFETLVPARAIISRVAPGVDRLEEREFIVDPRYLGDVHLLEMFQFSGDEVSR